MPTPYPKSRLPGPATRAFDLELADEADTVNERWGGPELTVRMLAPAAAHAMARRPTSVRTSPAVVQRGKPR